MGLGEENEPPKKKLKQAQLCFTPKSQKRKLVSDVDDDVQFVKIIRKEPTTNESVNINDKENHLSVKKSVPQESERVLLPASEPIENSIPEVKKTDSVNEFIDLTEENAFLPPQETTPGSKKPESQNNTPDFSLSISDSVFEAINNKPSESNNETSNNESTCSNDNEKPESLDESIDDSELNETLRSDDGNDATCLSSSNEDTTPNKKTGSSSSTPKRKLTPKRLESIKKKEERERLKSEKKAALAKRKEEKNRLLEEEKKRKKEAKEQKKLAEQKLREEERKAKEEERKKKDEEKKQKEEEKKKKDEEKRRREEAKEEEKKKKEEIEEKKKAAFAKFFKKNKQREIVEKNEDLEGNNFMPFPVKPDMKLAPLIRRSLDVDEKELLDSTFTNEINQQCDLYLAELKNGKHSPQKTEATWPLSLLEEEHDVIIIESTTNENCEVKPSDSPHAKERNRKMKAKLLQFHDNRRPPYWGTWRKESKAVTPRRPLGQDKVIFDYEVDSDSEWEDEGEGEDIDKEGDSDGEGSGDEEETQSGENGYILDNTFVPHGYLSDEEVQPDEDIEDNEPEDQKIRMTLLKQEFDEEMKTKTERLKPKLLGCVWISNGITEVSSGSLYEGLMAYRAVWAEDSGSIDVAGPDVEDSPVSTPLTKKVFPQSVLESLIKFVHGSNLPLSAIIKEFLLVVNKEHPSEHVSKRAVTLKIKEIAFKTYDYSTGKPTWTVNPPLLEEFGLKPLNEIPSAPPPTTAPAHVDKPKESPLLTFFKGTMTPPIKKRVPFITLPKTSFDYTPGKLNERGGVKDFGTPRPVDPVLRKRAQLITLSTSIGNGDKEEKSATNGNSNDKVINDLTKTSETINLCTDSQ